MRLVKSFSKKKKKKKLSNFLSSSPANLKLFVSPFSLITLCNLKKYFIFLGDKNEIKEFIIVIKISVLIYLKNKMSQNGFDDSLLINPLSTNPTKWSNTLDELSECVLLFCGVGA